MSKPFYFFIFLLVPILAMAQDHSFQKTGILPEHNVMYLKAEKTSSNFILKTLEQDFFKNDLVRKLTTSYFKEEFPRIEDNFNSMASANLSNNLSNSFETPNFTNINRTWNLVLFETGGCR